MTVPAAQRLFHVEDNRTARQSMDGPQGRFAVERPSFIAIFRDVAKTRCADAIIVVLSGEM